MSCSPTRSPRSGGARCRAPPTPPHPAFHPFLIPSGACIHSRYRHPPLSLLCSGGHCPRPHIPPADPTTPSHLPLPGGRRHPGAVCCRDAIPPIRPQRRWLAGTSAGISWSAETQITRSPGKAEGERRPAARRRRSRCAARVPTREAWTPATSNSALHLRVFSDSRGGILAPSPSATLTDAQAEPTARPLAPPVPPPLPLSPVKGERHARPLGCALRAPPVLEPEEERLCSSRKGRARSDLRESERAMSRGRPAR